MAASCPERAELVAQFVQATDWSCDNGEALLAAHNWSLQDALAEALGVDPQAHEDIEQSARRSLSRQQEQFDRDVAAAVEASRKDAAVAPARPPPQQPEVAPDVRQLLEQAGLAAFIATFAEHGYDELGIVAQMGPADLDEVGLKGGHKLKLREALRQRGLLASSRPSDEASSPLGGGAALAARPVAEATTPGPQPGEAKQHSPGGAGQLSEGPVAASPAAPPAAAPAEASREAAARGLLARLGGQGSSATRGASKRYIKDGIICHIDEHTSAGP